VWYISRGGPKKPNQLSRTADDENTDGDRRETSKKSKKQGAVRLRHTSERMSLLSP